MEQYIYIFYYICIGKIILLPVSDIELLSTVQILRAFERRILFHLNNSTPSNNVCTLESIIVTTIKALVEYMM